MIRPKVGREWGGRLIGAGQYSGNTSSSKQKAGNHAHPARQRRQKLPKFLAPRLKAGEPSESVFGERGRGRGAIPAVLVDFPEAQEASMVKRRGLSGYLTSNCIAPRNMRSILKSSPPQPQPFFPSRTRLGSFVLEGEGIPQTRVDLRSHSTQPFFRSKYSRRRTRKRLS